MRVPFADIGDLTGSSSLDALHDFIDAARTPDKAGRFLDAVRGRGRRVDQMDALCRDIYNAEKHAACFGRKAHLTHRDDSADEASTDRYAPALRLVLRDEFDSCRVMDYFAVRGEGPYQDPSPRLVCCR